jgi:hypothetical protein
MQKTIQIRIVHKNLRTYEIQQREQLLQAILQRGASDQQSAPGNKGVGYLRKDGIDIPDPVRFVDYDILETELLERRFFDEADLAVCDAAFEILRDESVRNDFCARLLFR